MSICNHFYISPDVPVQEAPPHEVLFQSCTLISPYHVIFPIHLSSKHRASDPFSEITPLTPLTRPPFLSLSMISVASSVRSAAVVPNARAQNTNFCVSRAVHASAPAQSLKKGLFTRYELVALVLPWHAAFFSYPAIFSHSDLSISIFISHLRHLCVLKLVSVQSQELLAVYDRDLLCGGRCIHRWHARPEEYHPGGGRDGNPWASGCAESAGRGLRSALLGASSSEPGRFSA